jgi:hypothetical protein
MDRIHRIGVFGIAILNILSIHVNYSFRDATHSLPLAVLFRSAVLCPP